MSGIASPLVPAADVAHALGLLGKGAWEALRGKRIFVTGGTGFVGKWMLSALLEADRRHDLGVSMVLLSRNPEAFRTNTPSIAEAPSVHLLRGDVRDFQASELGPVDAVIHGATDVVAASRSLDTFDTCVTGTRRVLDFAVQSGASDFLLISSGAVYGYQPSDVPGVQESSTNAPDSLSPTSAYGLGKRACEWLVGTYASEYDLRGVIARCFAFVGPLLPLDKQFAVGNFMRDALAGHPISVQGDGSAIRSYLHTADMTGWLWRIFFDGRSGSAYNVGGDEAISIADLAHRVSRVIGSNSPVVMAHAPVPSASVNRYVPDTRLVREEFGLPAPIALDDAILRTAKWLRCRLPERRGSQIHEPEHRDAPSLLAPVREPTSRRKSMNRRVVLTGITGFLGSHLARALVLEGYDVVGLKRRTSSLHRVQAIANHVRLFDVENLDFDEIFAQLGPVDTIIHTATNYGRNGESVSEIFAANTEFPLRLMDSGQRAGVQTFLNTDTILDKHLNLYAFSKNQLLEWGEFFCLHKKITFLNLRLEHFYGPDDEPSKFTAHVINSCLNNVTELDLTRGDQRRDFIHVDDVVSAYLLLLAPTRTFSEAFMEFDVGSGRSVSIREFVEAVHRITGSTTRLNFGALRYREGEIMHSEANVAPLEAIGWRCQNDMETGIRRVVELERNKT